MKELEAFNQLKTEIAGFVEPAMRSRVQGIDTCNDALESAKIVKSYTKKIDAERDKLVRPLKEQIKKIDDYCKQIKAPLESAEAHLRAELNRFAEVQEKVRQEELRKAREEQARKEAELLAKQEEERAAAAQAADVFGADTTEAEELAKKQAAERAAAFNEASLQIATANAQNLSNVRKSWTVEVVDMKAVPDVFLIVKLNEKMAIDAHKGGQTIPGLRFIEKVAVAIGANTRAPGRAVR